MAPSGSARRRPSRACRPATASPALVPPRRRAEGNVAADTLTTLRDAVPGVTVTNPSRRDRRSGGRDARERARARAAGAALARAAPSPPATSSSWPSGAPARSPARMAFTQAAMWAYATPGTVEVVLVPSLPEMPRRRRPSYGRGELDGPPEPTPPRAGRPGASTRAGRWARAASSSWARYKTVRVRAEIVVQGEEDSTPSVAASTSGSTARSTRCHRASAPAAGRSGSPSTRRASTRSSCRSRASAHARGVRLLVDEAPDRDVHALASDPHQPRTWYAGSGDSVFRSLNDGDGWELMARFDGRQVRAIEASEHVPGLVAVATVPVDGAGSQRPCLARRRRHLAVRAALRVPRRGPRLGHARRRTGPAHGHGPERRRRRRRPVPAGGLCRTATRSRSSSTQATRTWRSTP